MRSGLADRLAEALSLDGTGRLLDVGCGPGVVTLVLARHFAEGIGVDPDVGMLAEAQRRAAVAGIANFRWVLARAEELPLDLGTFRMASFAQSFHWMDQPLVAAIVFDMLETGGALVHISEVKMPRETSLRCRFQDAAYDDIQQLVERYLGAVRRAGQGLLHGTPGDEASGCPGPDFLGPERIVVPATEPFIRTIDDVVAWVYSRSGSAPHLFDARREQFETELRQGPAGHPRRGYADQPSTPGVYAHRAGGQRLHERLLPMIVLSSR